MCVYEAVLPAMLLASLTKRKKLRSVRIQAVSAEFMARNACKSSANVLQIYCNWRWPTPIVLQQIDHNNPMGMKQWDPRLDYRDQSHLMPIITPAYPCMNSSYNVSESTLKIMMVRQC